MSDIPPPQPPEEPIQPPQTFVQYPRSHYLPPTIDLAVLGQAWSLLQQQMSSWVVAALIVGGVYIGAVGGVVMLIMASQLATAGSPSFSQLMMTLFLEFVGGLVVNAVVFVMCIGLFGMGLKQLRGEPISPSDLFNYNGQGQQAILAALMVAALTTVGQWFCYLPGLILGGLLMFSIPIVLDQKISAVDALKLSIEKLRSQMWMATIAYFVLCLIAGAGIIACGFGVLITAPLMILSVSCFYRDFFWNQPQTPSFASPPQTG